MRNDCHFLVLPLVTLESWGGGDDRVQAHPLHSQLWAAGGLGVGEWIGVECWLLCQHAKLKLRQGTRASFAAEERLHSPLPLHLRYTQDLWQYGFCLFFPESQFTGLRWRRPCEEGWVREAGTSQALSHWEPSIEGNHFLDIISPNLRLTVPILQTQVPVRLLLISRTILSAHPVCSSGLFQVAGVCREGTIIIRTTCCSFFPLALMLFL